MIKRVGKIWQSEANGWVYTTGSLCPTICAHNGVQSKIIVYEDDTDMQPQRRQQVLGDIDGIARTLLSTYYKIGCYNVFEKGFMAVIEYEDNTI